MTLRSWIIGRVGSVPTIFRFVGFATCFAFERFACTRVSLTIVFSGLHPFISLQFSAFCLIVSKFVAVEAISFFDILRCVVDLFGLSFCWGWFYLV